MFKTIIITVLNLSIYRGIYSILYFYLISIFIVQLRIEAESPNIDFPFLGWLGGVVFLILSLLGLLGIIALQNIFKKLGEKGRKTLIPILNT